MVEKELSEKLLKIFKLKKVSFDDPGPAGEQECLFINIENSRPSIGDQLQKIMVQGSCAIFGTNEKLPIGYIPRCIQEANHELTKNFHFYEMETSTRRFKDKVQRGFSFIYFFRAQYDPDKGLIDEIQFTTEET